MLQKKKKKHDLQALVSKLFSSGMCVYAPNSEEERHDTDDADDEDLRHHMWQCVQNMSCACGLVHMLTHCCADRLHKERVTQTCCVCPSRRKTHTVCFDQLWTDRPLLCNLSELHLTESL